MLIQMIEYKSFEYKSFIHKYSLVRENTNQYKTKVHKLEDVIKIIENILPDDIQEHFGVIFLNRANNTIGYRIISTGGIHNSIVDIRILFKYAIECLCSGMILFHNHPSGNYQPSESDIKLTNQIQEAAKLFNINVMDHIILTDKYNDGEKQFFSFANEGIL